VSDSIAPEAMAALEAEVRRDPGADAFPILAETLRRAGRPDAAEEVARRGLEHRPDSSEGLLVLALSLLDLGRVGSAHELLADRTGEMLLATESPHPAADAHPEADDFDGAVSEGELDAAFADASLDRDQLIDADDMAQSAMRAADLDDPEGMGEATSDPTFATQTMAEVLERQGDLAGAERIRASIGPETLDPWPRARHQAVIETLETWLSNLRRVER